MEKKIFVNWALPLGLTIGFFIFALLAVLFLFPAFHTEKWIIYGTFTLGPIISYVSLTKVSPLILIIHNNTATFIGLPWVFRIRRDKLARVMIRTYGFGFIPKNPKDYRWASMEDKGELKGYKVLRFWNLKAWGELITFLKPDEIVINWPALKEKEKSYILEKIAELEESNPKGDYKHDSMP